VLSKQKDSDVGIFFFLIALAKRRKGSPSSRLDGGKEECLEKSLSVRLSIPNLDGGEGQGSGAFVQGNDRGKNSALRYAYVAKKRRG